MFAVDGFIYKARPEGLMLKRYDQAAIGRKGGK
jgi:hypothetical protein